VKDWQATLAAPSMPVLDAMKLINQNAARIVLAVDEAGRLIGTATDGDIRRGLLAGVTLDSPLERVLHRDPVTIPPGTPNEQVLALMRDRQISQVPIVDKEGLVHGLSLVDNLARPEIHQGDTWVVLMVGGQGQRLRPLTNDTPKPMLSVGERPLLEIILGQLVDQGFTKFFFSVNYMADAIRDYFGDGAKLGVRIEYLEEKTRMGTAGALSLLPGMPEGPIIVMNGDLLTNVNFGHILSYHRSLGACATMGVREYDIKIDFGVVEVSEGVITGLQEKPVHQFLINGGIYVLEPEVLAHIAEESYLDMPVLFQQLVDDEKKCVVFPIVEYWLDVGRRQDLDEAQYIISKI